MRRVLLTTPFGLAPDGSWPRRVPDHYGFGISRFRDYGYEVVPLPVVPPGSRLDALRHLPAQVGTRYGDLAFQVALWRERLGVDLVYDPWDVKGNALALAGLRRARVLRTPLVAFIHARPISEWPAWQRPARELFLAGCDGLAAMSASVADELASRRRWAPRPRRRLRR